MKFKNYLTIWVLILIVVGFEYWNLNFHSERSLLLLLQAKGYIRANLKIGPEPGRQVSLWLGWLGLGLMVLMNVYSLRKRLRIGRSWGQLSNWLDFHVFCGLVGPTLIMFHCNFKVRGLVGISFWSMVVSFSSGVIGRYFYLQLVGKKNEFETKAQKCKDKLVALLEKHKIATDINLINPVLDQALVQVGLTQADEELNPFNVMMRSIVSDTKLFFQSIAIAKNWPDSSRHLVQAYALNRRHSVYLEPFQKLMGYWHAFHFPFAVFMYLAAVIHVVASLIFGTGR